MPTVSSDEETARWELAEELVSRAVRRGARYIDRRWPGWLQERFDLERFDIVSGCGCVLGQYYVDTATPEELRAASGSMFYYATALEELGISADYASLLGFDIPCDDLQKRLGLEELYDDQQWYKILQSEWVAEYMYRLTTAEMQDEERELHN